MTIKIECPCGTKVAFDVEPEDGRMPVPVACPGCEADVTELANRYIAVSEAPTRTLRVAREVEPAAEGSSKQAALQRVQAVAQHRAPIEEERATARDVAELQRWRGPFRIALAALVVLFGVWIWYSFFGSRPRATFLLTASKEAPFRFTQMLGKDRVFVLRDDKAAVYAADTGNEVWAAPFAPAERSQSRADSLFLDVSEPIVRRIGNALWVEATGKLIQLDAATGRRLSEVALPQPSSTVEAGETSVVAVVETAPYQRALTRIDLTTGKATTELFTIPALPGAGVRNSPADRATVDNEFRPLGSQVAVLSSRLLEERFITRDGPSTESRQAREEKPLLERENLRAADSTEAAVQFLNAGKGGPVEYDESRYQVMLQRLFVGSTPWTAEVVGPPTLHSAGGFEFLSSGTDLRAFDSGNRLLWTAKLSYPLNRRFHGDELSPFLAAGARLYVADLGTLTAFELRTGKVAWRLPTVGISQTVAAGDALYVSTTSAGPETIQPTGNLRDTGRTFPILMKVEAATGKILWQIERLADRAWPSGKFLYLSRAAVAALDEMSASMNGTDAAVKFHLRRVEPSTGKVLWEWHQDGRPTVVDPVGNQILVAGPTKVQVLRFQSW